MYNFYAISIRHCGLKLHRFNLNRLIGAATVGLLLQRSHIYRHTY